MPETSLFESTANGPLAEGWAEAGPTLMEEDDASVRADVLRHRLRSRSAAQRTASPTACSSDGSSGLSNSAIPRMCRLALRG